MNAIAREAGSALLGKVMGAPGGAPAPDKQKAEGEAKQKAEMEAKQRLEEAKKKLRGLFK